MVRFVENQRREVKELGEKSKTNKASIMNDRIEMYFFVNIEIKRVNNSLKIKLYAHGSRVIVALIYAKAFQNLFVVKHVGIVIISVVLELYVFVEMILVVNNVVVVIQKAVIRKSNVQIEVVLQ
jgi:hypothetical protein